jgi:ceramide glucosyltransferase
MAVWLTGAFRRESSAPAPNIGARFSQVKPVYQATEKTLAAIETFLDQDQVAPHDVYLCSAQAGPEKWLSAHPQVTWLRLAADQSQNGKAATLALGYRYWSGDIFVVTDADMRAQPCYLGQVLSPFVDPEVGVVTCLYRSTAPSPGDWCHLLEALCILDFSASVLVARRTEGVTFAMGSTMAVRRETLERIGGFQALTPYLADDYQLGHRAHKAGYKVRLAPGVVLETDPPQGDIGKALSHQYRWLVTSRVSRPGGHLAFAVTQGFLWASLLTIANPALGTKALLGWCSLRVLCGLKAYRDLGGPARGAWQTLFLPWKDVLYLGLWVASLWGNTVRWGDREITIDREGRIVS